MKHLLLVVLLCLQVPYSISSGGNALKKKANVTQIPSYQHTEYPTYYAHVNGVRLAYQDFGNSNDTAILLVMGLGGQLIHWEDDFVLSLVKQGFRVIRYDNRDSGWSSKFYDHDTPGVFTLLRYKLGLPLGAPYLLDDMAADGIALLNHLSIEQAHVAGMSMGGMIAQIMAANNPKRVITLTSIMSTSGDPHLPEGELQPSLESVDGLNRTQIIQSRAAFAQQIDGSLAELSEAQWLQRMARGYDRSYYPDGTARQLWAIGDSGDRSQLLKKIEQPSLVVHGTDDPLISVQGAKHTAEMIKNSKLVLVDGMGHFLDKISEQKLLNEMLEFYQ